MRRIGTLEGDQSLPGTETRCSPGTISGRSRVPRVLSTPGAVVQQTVLSGTYLFVGSFRRQTARGSSVMESTIPISLARRLRPLTAHALLRTTRSPNSPRCPPTASLNDLVPASHVTFRYPRGWGPVGTASPRGDVLNSTMGGIRSAHRSIMQMPAGVVRSCPHRSSAQIHPQPPSAPIAESPPACAGSTPTDCAGSVDVGQSQPLGDRRCAFLGGLTLPISPDRL